MLQESPKNYLTKALHKNPIIARLRTADHQEALDIVGKFYLLGIRAVEVSIDAPSAYEIIELICREYKGEMAIGASSVLTSKDVEMVVSAGGMFCISPIVDKSVLDTAKELKIIPILSVYTPNEIVQALSIGATDLCLFTASAYGGGLLCSVSSLIPNHVNVFVSAELAVGGEAQIFESSCSVFLVDSSSLDSASSFNEARLAVKELLQLSLQEGSSTIACLTDVKAGVGEGITYKSETNELIWVDATKPRLFIYSLDSGKTEERVLPVQLSKVLDHPKYGLIGLSSDSIYRLDVDSQQAELLTQVARINENCMLNDATLDNRGRIWMGTMNRALLSSKGQLFCFEDSLVTEQSNGHGVCNGVGFSSDGQTFYMVDTLYRNLIAFEVSSDGLQLGAARIVSDFMNVPGKPDGLAIADDGNIWVAMWGGGCLVELAIDGSLVRTVKLPTPHPNAPIFVPSDPSHIYITTSRMRLNENQLIEHPMSGELLRISL